MNSMPGYTETIRDSVVAHICRHFAHGTSDSEVIRKLSQRAHLACCYLRDMNDSITCYQEALHVHKHLGESSSAAISYVRLALVYVCRAKVRRVEVDQKKIDWNEYLKELEDAARWCDDGLWFVRSLSGAYREEAALNLLLGMIYQEMAQGILARWADSFATYQAAVNTLKSALVIVQSFAKPLSSYQSGINSLRQATIMKEQDKQLLEWARSLIGEAIAAQPKGLRPQVMPGARLHLISVCPDARQLKDNYPEWDASEHLAACGFYIGTEHMYWESLAPRVIGRGKNGHTVLIEDPNDPQQRGSLLPWYVLWQVKDQGLTERDVDIRMGDYILIERGKVKIIEDKGVQVAAWQALYPNSQLQIDTIDFPVAFKDSQVFLYTHCAPEEMVQEQSKQKVTFVGRVVAVLKRLPSQE